jgi:hypothetical protein
MSRRASRAHHPLARALACTLACSAVACLDTRGREPVGYSPHVLPRSAVVRDVADNEVLAKRIGMNDAVDALVPLQTGYVAGREVQYWDFGTASASAEPVWLFRRHGAGGMPEPVDHPDLIDSVPGDMSYSPVRVPYLVYVTAAYRGERITSVQALEDAIDVGLLEEPESTEAAVNWPVVLADTRLELGGGQAPLAPEPAYYRGVAVTQLKLGAEQEGFALQRGSVSPASAYMLRRQNEAGALEEGSTMNDFNADGDMADSNIVFSLDVSEEGYCSLWSQIDVIVAPDYAWGAVKDEAALFERSEAGLIPIDGAFVAFAESDTLLNRPLRPAP